MADLIVTLGCMLAVALLWLVFATLAVVGDIAAVTQWIPTAGAHGTNPGTLVYIALYALLVFGNVCVWTLLAAPIANLADAP